METGKTGSWEVILQHCLYQRHTVNSGRNCNAPRSQIKSEILGGGEGRHGFSSSGVSPQQDNTGLLQLVVGGSTPSAILKKFGTERFSQTSAPKRGLTWTKLRIWSRRLREVAKDWLTQQPKEFFRRGIYTLVEAWRRCLEPSWGYTEGQCHFTVLCLFL
jgi:hypothetical protein